MRELIKGIQKNIYQQASFKFSKFPKKIIQICTILGGERVEEDYNRKKDIPSGGCPGGCTAREVEGSIDLLLNYLNYSTNEKTRRIKFAAY
jgi:hypothetical protein